MRRFFFLFLLFSIVFSLCPTGESSISVAAVVGEAKGEIFELYAKVVPGNGSVYTAINPKIGISTQESQEIATDYAFRSANKNKEECDVFYKIKGKFNETTIDGPSAGAAMEIALKAILLNKSIRKDVVITGTIDKNGKIGEVGGIIEKGLASVQRNKKYFLFPKGSMVYEYFLLFSLAKKSEFHPIGISDVQEAEKIFFSDYNKTFESDFVLQSNPLPKLPKNDLDSDLVKFYPIAESLIFSLDEKIKNNFAQNENYERASIKKYLSLEVEKFKSLLYSGYLFSAANSAFLLSIESEFVQLSDNNFDLNNTITQVRSCSDALVSSKKTKENIHWAIGSDLRRIWSKEKLSEVELKKDFISAYSSLRDLLYSFQWCQISSQLYAQAQKEGGKEIDESVLSELASQRLAKAQEKFKSSIDYDAFWHLKNAQKANSSGYFGAAIYEAVYADTMQSIMEEGIKDSKAKAEVLIKEQRKTLWGKLYQAHGIYLYYEALEKNYSFDSSYKILRFASELDKAAQEIDKILSQERPSLGLQIEQSKPTTKGPIFAFISIIVILAGLIALYRLINNIRLVSIKSKKKKSD